MDPVSDFRIEKNSDASLLRKTIVSLLSQGWIPWQFGSENIGLPEFWCALVKSPNTKTVAAVEIPKIETALTLLKTDTTANSLGVQLTAITTAVTAITDLNLGNGTATNELGKITTAITNAKSIANAQVLAITTSKNLIKNA